MATPTSGASMGSKAEFEKAFNEIMTGGSTSEADTTAILSKYFNPAYTQTTDGKVSTYEEFVAHLTHLRSVLEKSETSVTVHEFLRDGNMIAERHVVRAKLKTSSALKVFEVYLIGELDELERLKSVKELVRMLQGNEEDRDLGVRTA